MKKTAVLFLALGCFVFLVCGCGPSNPAPAPKAPVPKVETSPGAVTDAKDLFRTSCTVCHNVARIENYKGAEPWKAIVDRMIKDHGAKITPENAALIVAYLEKTFPKK